MISAYIIVLMKHVHEVIKVKNRSGLVNCTAMDNVHVCQIGNKGLIIKRNMIICILEILTFWYIFPVHIFSIHFTFLIFLNTTMHFYYAFNVVTAISLFCEISTFDLMLRYKTSLHNYKTNIMKSLEPFTCAIYCVISQ